MTWLFIQWKYSFFWKMPYRPPLGGGVSFRREGEGGGIIQRGRGAGIRLSPVPTNSFTSANRLLDNNCQRSQWAWPTCISGFAGDFCVRKKMQFSLLWLVCNSYWWTGCKVESGVAAAELSLHLQMLGCYSTHALVMITMMMMFAVVLMMMVVKIGW